MGQSRGPPNLQLIKFALYMLFDAKMAIPSASFMLDEMGLSSTDLVNLAVALRSALPMQLSRDMRRFQDVTDVALPDLGGLVRGALFLHALESKYPEVMPPAGKRSGSFKGYIGNILVVLTFDGWCHNVLLPYCESRAAHYTVVDEGVAACKIWADESFAKLWTQCAGFIQNVSCSVMEFLEIGGTDVSDIFYHPGPGNADSRLPSSLPSRPSTFCSGKTRTTTSPPSNGL